MAGQQNSNDQLEHSLDQARTLFNALYVAVHIRDNIGNAGPPRGLPVDGRIPRLTGLIHQNPAPPAMGNAKGKAKGQGQAKAPMPKGQMPARLGLPAKAAPAAKAAAAKAAAAKVAAKGAAKALAKANVKGLGKGHGQVNSCPAALPAAAASVAPAPALTAASAAVADDARRMFVGARSVRDILASAVAAGPSAATPASAGKAAGPPNPLGLATAVAGKAAGPGGPHRAVARSRTPIRRHTV